MYPISALANPIPDESPRSVVRLRVRVVSSLLCESALLPTYRRVNLDCGPSGLFSLAVSDFRTSSTPHSFERLDVFALTIAGDLLTRLHSFDSHSSDNALSTEVYRRLSDSPQQWFR